MRLALIRQGLPYEILAVRSGPAGEVPLLEALEALRSEDLRLSREVTAWLYERLPFHGPAAISKHIGNEIWQMSFGRLPGIGFRCLWFSGERPREIICTYGFTKRLGESSPLDSIRRRAEGCREVFFDELSRGGRHEVQLIEGTI